MCQHEWNRRGTNAHVRIKTCHRCGIQEVLRYKDNQKTTRYVDVNQLKKSGCEHDVRLDKKLLNQILQIRLIGEVFSPERFTKKASQHGLDPGKAYDLELGHQLLDPENRRKCLNISKTTNMDWL